ncbi:DegV family protein [Exiguobacterium sp. SL-9]|jgi:DegV family protein with EDD domain|uniref:DegV family protein n=1 Tax=Exiguobacterium sp. SL-9 TaxID=2510963 RepID=UPI00103DD064|nr:DegV family protein [Exiguobacterium sp. SL-9]TCI22420.1 DegV family protein [Exiguobacterium sp. SL-9]
MGNIAILTDSTAYLPAEFCEQHDVHVAPLSVIFDGESFREDVDITTEAFYDRIEAGNLPTTSQPSIGETIEMIERLPEDVTDVIAITLSSGISGTYQSMIALNGMVDINVHAFDSEISCMPQSFLVEEAIHLRDAGASAQEIMAHLEKVRELIRAYFVVDDLDHLQRGGRLSAAQALVGSFLQIKPVLHFQDRLIVPFEKIRTYKKAVRRIEEMMEQSIEGDGAGYCIGIIHANCPDRQAEEIASMKQKFPQAHVTGGHFGPVIGTHLGPGAIGITWYRREW